MEVVLGILGILFLVWVIFLIWIMTISETWWHDWEDIIIHLPLAIFGTCVFLFLIYGIIYYVLK